VRPALTLARPLRRYLVVPTLLLALASGASAASSTLPGLRHEYQRLNNCGPVTALMTLSLFGKAVTQAAAADALRTSKLDRNVTVDEMASYLARFGLLTAHRLGGDANTLRRLIAAGVPVVLHQQMKLTDDIGHYRVAYGFDDDGITSGDSFLGPKLWHSDADLASLWRPYGGEYLVAYKPEQQAKVAQALGQDWNRRANLQRVATNMQARVSANPKDALSWSALGRARLELGAPSGAAKAFLEAHKHGLPAKHYWYQDDALRAWNRVGWFDTTRRVAARALVDYPMSTEIGLSYARALLNLKQPAAARRAYQALLVEDPNNPVARQQLMALAGG
jgi:tetratricopeptide (TPR) repeat protein